MVERTQPVSLVTELVFVGDRAIVRVAEHEIILRLHSTRRQIAQSLRDRGLGVLDPFVGEPDTIPGDPNSQEAWCELLDDLGSYSNHLGHIDSRLTYLELHRDETLARIVVGNGLRIFSHTVQLDGGELPAAVAVDIAGAFEEEN